jgi:hypothetical protein
MKESKGICRVVNYGSSREVHRFMSQNPKIIILEVHPFINWKSIMISVLHMLKKQLTDPKSCCFRVETF